MPVVVPVAVGPAAFAVRALAPVVAVPPVVPARVAAVVPAGLVAFVWLPVVVLVAVAEPAALAAVGHVADRAAFVVAASPGFADQTAVFAVGATGVADPL